MRRVKPKQLAFSEWKLRHLKTSGTIVTNPSFLSRFGKEVGDYVSFHMYEEDKEEHWEYVTARNLQLKSGHRVTVPSEITEDLDLECSRRVYIRAVVGDYDSSETVTAPYGLGFCPKCGKVIKGGDEIVSIETGMVNEAGSPTAQKDSYQMFNIHKKCHRETE